MAISTSLDSKKPLVRIDPLRLLIVDDNRDEADSLAILLGYRGYHIDVAYSACEALELASRCRPEVLLLDLGLPGMSGYELATQLQHKLDHPVLIATTGFADEAYRRKAQEVGFEHHFVKPVSVARLRQVLESVVAARRSRAGSAVAGSAIGGSAVAGSAINGNSAPPTSAPSGSAVSRGAPSNGASLGGASGPPR